MTYQCSKKLVKYIVVLTILTFKHIQCLHLMYVEVAWVLVCSGTQVQPQVKLDPDYLPDCLSVSYDYDNLKKSIVISISRRVESKHYSMWHSF